MKGSYLLIVEVKNNFEKKIGSLGKIEFKKGFYCYVGSALGKSVNLENRIRRHLRKKKKVRWHIDYLLNSKFARIYGIIVIVSKKKEECKISKRIEKFADGSIKGFGSSDCKCKSHLHYFSNLKKLIEVIERL